MSLDSRKCVIILENLSVVGEYNTKFNEILELSLDEQSIYQADGLKTHIERRHPECLGYLDLIPQIIQNPDFIGVNPREKSGESVELIKRFDSNILIGIKLDTKNKYLYVATLHEIRESRIERQLHSGRLKKYIVDEQLINVQKNVCNLLQKVV